VDLTQHAIKSTAVKGGQAIGKWVEDHKLLTAATIGVVGVGLYLGFRRTQSNPNFKPKVVNPAAV